MGAVAPKTSKTPHNFGLQVLLQLELLRKTALFSKSPGRCDEAVSNFPLRPQILEATCYRSTTLCRTQ